LKTRLSEIHSTNSIKEETEEQELILFVDHENSSLPMSTSPQQTHRHQDATL
jgi:hypothetical protein